MIEGMVGGVVLPAMRAEYPSSIWNEGRKGLQAQRYFIPAFPVVQESR